MEDTFSPNELRNASAICECVDDYFNLRCGKPVLSDKEIKIYDVCGV